MKSEMIASLLGGLMWVTSIVLAILNGLHIINISWWWVAAPVIILVTLSIILAIFALGIIQRNK